MTMQERAVFDVLAAHAGRVISRTEIARSAGIADLSDRRCDALIVGIRRRIGAERIRTVRRRGWMLIDGHPATSDGSPAVDDQRPGERTGHALETLHRRS